VVCESLTDDVGSRGWSRIKAIAHELADRPTGIHSVVIQAITSGIGALKNSRLLETR
jgi:hypothetical protein